MYGRRVTGELSTSVLDEARLGFVQYLRRKRFSSQFIARHADELFATAALEYSRKVAEGTEIDSPAGWLITCAWRRTKSQLEAQGRSPQIVSTDKAEAMEDELGQSPEDVALDEDRLRKVQQAVDQLSLEEQRLLELAYFEGMAVREAARQLQWHPSKAQRCHEVARKHLHQLLDVDSLDELEIILGLGAYVSLAERTPFPHLPPGVETVAETISRGAAYGWARTQELARRLPFGGATDPSASAALGGGVGRAAGVCATAALACLASGVVGPGVGGLNLIGGGHSGSSSGSGSAHKQRSVAAAPRVGPFTPRSNPALSPPPETTVPRSPSGGERHSTGGAISPANTRQTKLATQAVRSQSLESAAGTAEASSTPSEPVAESSPPSPPSSTSGSSSSPTQVANQQFGP